MLVVTLTASLLLFGVADAFCGLPTSCRLGISSRVVVSSNLVKMSGNDFPVVMKWIDVGSAGDFPFGITAVDSYKDESLAIVRDVSGKLVAIVDKSPYLGVPLSYGSVIECNGETCIRCPQSKTLFSLRTGKVVGDWIPFPPVINNVLRLVVGDANDIIKYPLKVKNGKVQVEVDVNAKDRFESQYWRGLLDAQGKAEGRYY